MEINPAYKAFLSMGWLFLMSATFTLAKTLRDAHDNQLATARQKNRSLCAACERE